MSAIVSSENDLQNIIAEEAPQHFADPDAGAFPMIGRTKISQPRRPITHPYFRFSKRQGDRMSCRYCSFLPSMALQRSWRSR